jgi:hypothetical protein
MNMKNTWRSSENARNFGITYCLQVNLPHLSSGNLLGLFVDPEAGDDIFLRNIGAPSNYIRDSSVGIATVYGLDSRRSIPSKGKKLLYSP